MDGLSSKLDKIFSCENLVERNWFSNKLEINENLVPYLQQELKDYKRFKKPDNFAKDLIHFLAYDARTQPESADILK